MEQCSDWLPATASTTWSTTTCCRSPRSSSSRPRSCSSTTPSTTACCTPLGIDQAAEQGQSVLFLLEANPGPGLGLLLAYTFFGKGVAKASAPGAAIIQFFGGIHEVYFPYVLMKPKLILAMIAGGMTGISYQPLFDIGLRAPAAPGSIFAVYAQTPASGDFLGITLSRVLGGGAVSLPGRRASCSRWTRPTTTGDLDGRHRPDGGP